MQFQIQNETNQRIEHITIEPSLNDDKHYFQLEPNELANYSQNMSTSEKSEGSFSLSYKIGNKYFRENFGYYSNGMTLADLTIIKIQKDTVIYQHFVD